MFNLIVVDTQLNPYCQGGFPATDLIKLQEKRRDFGLMRQTRLERRAGGDGGGGRWAGVGVGGGGQGLDSAWERQPQGDRAALRARGKPGRGTEGRWRRSWGPARPWEGPRAPRWPGKSRAAGQPPRNLGRCAHHL